MPRDRDDDIVGMFVELPRWLHKEIKLAAVEDGVTLREIVTQACLEYLDLDEE